jgi:hypothetical protein
MGQPKSILFFIVFGLITELAAMASSVSAPLPAPGSVQLVENSSQWNGRRILFIGEAIGERQVRVSGAWIHLNDDAYMWKNIEEGAKLGGFNSGQAIWVSAGLAFHIRFFGDYKTEGDIVEVTGIFNATCPEHGGDMDIHATELRIVREGHRVAHIPNSKRLTFGCILLLLSTLLYFLRLIARRRRI